MRTSRARAVFSGGPQVVTAITCHRGDAHPVSLSNRRYGCQRQALIRIPLRAELEDARVLHFRRLSPLPSECVVDLELRPLPLKTLYTSRFPWSRSRGVAEAVSFRRTSRRRMRWSYIVPGMTSEPWRCGARRPAAARAEVASERTRDLRVAAAWRPQCSVPRWSW